MTTPIANAIVTAYPTQAGFPTLSGQTNNSGVAVLPLSDHTSYNFQFTSGAMGAVTNVFPPADHTYTLYRLKNVSPSTVPISVYPIFKFLNTEVGISRGTSQFALPGSYTVSIPAGRGPNFKSYKPGSLFGAPTNRSTTFKMPAKDASISVVSTAPAHLLVANGTESASSTVGGITDLTSYITSTNTWKSKTKAPTRRFRLAGAVGGGNLYVVCGEHSINLKTNQEYDPTTDVWATKASAPNATWGLAGGAVNSDLYAIDGSAGSFNQQYKISKNSWVSKAKDLNFRESLTAGVIGTNVYATDGLSLHTLAFLKNNNVYNTLSNVWAAKANDTSGRSGIAAAVVNSKYYVFDGYNGTSYPGANHVYNPSGNSWVTKTTDPTVRQNGGAATLGSKAYVVDGFSVGAAALAKNNAYDPSADTWSTKASDLIKRYWVATGVVP